MLRNYFKIAVRNLLKHRTFSAINIIGLSVGIACCVLLALYIKDEFSYENKFSNTNRIYRIYTTFTKDGVPERYPRTSPPIAIALPDLIPEVEIATRVINPPEVEQHLIKYGDELYYEKLGYLVDSTFFDVFDYAFKEGNRETAMDQPASVVLSSELSKRIFSDKSPLNEWLIINSGPSKDTFMVTGVLQPYTSKSHLDAGFYMSLRSEGWGDFINSVDSWAWQNFVSGYVRLFPKASPQTVDEKFPQLIETYAGDVLRGAGMKKELNLQALSDIHLYSDFNDGFQLETNGNIMYVYILGSIGIFILLIACINFMNLTTAKASQRAGEVGVRKSLGASRQNLIGQFLGESFTIVVVSMILSGIIIILTLPFFNQVTHKDLSLNGNTAAYVALSMLVISIVTGFVAGSYPAFFLSSFQPAKVLKDKRLSGGTQWLRKSLVVFQFIVSISLISAILIIQKQLDFIQNKSLGFNPEQNIVIPMRTSEARSNYVELKNSIQQIAGVSQVSATTSLPSTPLLRDYGLYLQGSSPDTGILHRMIYTDENYFDLLKINLIAGRDFDNQRDKSKEEDENLNVIVNQASLKEYNIDLKDAVGTTLLSEYDGKVRYHKIIGVVEVFHQFSLHDKIVPIMFKIPESKKNFIFITMSVATADYKNIISQLESNWKAQVPSTPFENTFLSDNVNKQYEEDQRVASIMTSFTLIAIIISCMGLYGLSVYMAERRIKEIGIRKVLGASVTGIVSLLTTDFLKLILIAFVIAAPLCYYAMGQWLQSFAYQTTLGVFVFVLAGTVSIAIAWITVGFESFRAAVGNPVNSLKTE